MSRRTRIYCVQGVEPAQIVGGKVTGPHFGAGSFNFVQERIQIVQNGPLVLGGVDDLRIQRIDARGKIGGHGGRHDRSGG